MFQRQSLARIARIAGVTTVCTLLVTPGLATIHARQAEQENVMSADVDDQEIEQFTRAFNDVLALIEAAAKNARVDAGPGGGPDDQAECQPRDGESHQKPGHRRGAV